MTFHRRYRLSIWVMLPFVALAPSAVAQTTGIASEFDREPSTDRTYLSRGSALPQLSFQLVTDIPVPGPLPAAGPRLEGDRIELPVASGTAVTGWTSDAILDIRPGEDDGSGTESEGWYRSEDGRYRSRALSTGWIRTEKQCKRCRRGWKKVWRLRVPGSLLPSPIVVGDRVYFGAKDNHLYAVKTRNGHRVWSIDAGGRISRPPLHAWFDPEANGTTPASEDVGGIVIVLPNDAAVLVLDAASGTRLAQYDLTREEGKIVGLPVVTPDGKLVIARQAFAEGSASLRVLELVVPPGSQEDSGL